MAETRKRILLVEDEAHLAFSLKFNLEADGFDVDSVPNGHLALDKFNGAGTYSLVILDVMLPGMDGFEVARQIRGKTPQVGILLLTARAGDEDRVTGFEAGADDYITKPFHLQELLLRVKRMVRRSDFFASIDRNRQSIVKCGPFELDTEVLVIKSPWGNHSLTSLEANVLAEFMRNPKRVLTREHLLQKVWGLSSQMETRTVDNFIARLRKYLEQDPRRPSYLLSVRGRGYRLIDDPRGL